jgi:hypothetical protein
MTVTCRVYWCMHLPFGHVDPIYIKIGYLDGVLKVMGPLEVAAMVRGLRKFLWSFIIS